MFLCQPDCPEDGFAYVGIELLKKTLRHAQQNQDHDGILLIARRRITHLKWRRKSWGLASNKAGIFLPALFSPIRQGITRLSPARGTTPAKVVSLPGCQNRVRSTADREQLRACGLPLKLEAHRRTPVGDFFRTIPARQN
jgi:hypothetical protein